MDVPPSATEHLRELLRQRQMIDYQIAEFLAGLLAASGTDPRRLVGLDEDAWRIEVTPDATE